MGLIDPSGHLEAALAIADAEALSDVAEDMHPAGLAGDSRIDEIQRSVEAAVAIGGDEGEVGAGETPGGEGHQEGLPGTLTLGADEAIVDQFPAPLGGDPIGDKDQPPLGPIGRFHAQAEAVEEQIPVSYTHLTLPTTPYV